MGVLERRVASMGREPQTTAGIVRASARGRGRQLLLKPVPTVFGSAALRASEAWQRFWPFVVECERADLV